MYARSLDGRTLTLGVSGMLWNRSLVMYDTETQSLWSHILGLAMQGPLEGARLERIPAVMTTWREWKVRHPGTTVLSLSRTAREYVVNFQRDYRRFALGVVVEGVARAYPFTVLAREPVVNDAMAGEQLTVTFDPDSTAARVFRRRVGGQSLTFEPAGGGRMRDAETGSLWDAALGVAIEGPFQGHELVMLPGIVSYLHVWRRFHPESSWYEAGRREQ